MRIQIMKLVFSVIFSAVFLAAGCNMFSVLDNPTEELEIIEQAKVDMDAGKCKEAAKLFEGKTGLSDDGYNTLGWAQLCAAGATMTKIGSSVFTFSSSGTAPLSVIGSLANKLVPQSAEGVTNIDAAISNFSQIKDVPNKNLNLVFGNLIKIGAILAKYASATGVSSKVERSDIGSAAIGGTTCNATCDGLVCGGDGLVTLTNADETVIKTTITALANAATSVGITLGNISDLTTLLNTTFPPGLGAGLVRDAVACNFLTE